MIHDMTIHSMSVLAHSLWHTSSNMLGTTYAFWCLVFHLRFNRFSYNVSVTPHICYSFVSGCNILLIDHWWYVGDHMLAMAYCLDQVHILITVYLLYHIGHACEVQLQQTLHKIDVDTSFWTHRLRHVSHNRLAMMYLVWYYSHGIQAITYPPLHHI